MQASRDSPLPSQRTSHGTAAKSTRGRGVRGSEASQSAGVSLCALRPPSRGLPRTFARVLSRSGRLASHERNGDGPATAAQQCRATAVVRKQPSRRAVYAAATLLLRQHTSHVMPGQKTDSTFRGESLRRCAAARLGVDATVGSWSCVASQPCSRSLWSRWGSRNRAGEAHEPPHRACSSIARSKSA